MPAHSWSSTVSHISQRMVMFTSIISRHRPHVVVFPPTLSMRSLSVSAGCEFLFAFAGFMVAGFELCFAVCLFDGAVLPAVGFDGQRYSSQGWHKTDPLSYCALNCHFCCRDIVHFPVGLWHFILVYYLTAVHF